MPTTKPQQIKASEEKPTADKPKAAKLKNTAEMAMNVQDLDSPVKT